MAHLSHPYMITGKNYSFDYVGLQILIKKKIKTCSTYIEQELC